MKSKAFPLVIWFTGMPCAGKTTLAQFLTDYLKAGGCHCTHIDGDQIRKTLCSDLGFTPEARKENLRRVAHLCNLLMERDTIVVASFVSPIEADRLMVRNMVKDEHFVEVLVGCSPSECQNRDVKGMYAEAKAGHRQGFTGIGSEYEIPTAPEIILNTTYSSEFESFEELKANLFKLKVL